VAVTGYDVYVNSVLNGTTTATTYTVSGLTAATTYSIYVRAKDAAGNGANSNTISVTTQSGGATTILAHYFETGWDGWADGGSDCARYTGINSYEGNYSIYIRDNTSTTSAMTSSAYNVSAYNQLVIDFYFYASSMEAGEDFWVRYYNGSTWSTVATYVAGTSFNNNSFYHGTITLTGVTFPANAQFRFQCDASDNSDLIYIDQVTVTGSNIPSQSGTENIQTCEPVAGGSAEFTNTESPYRLDVYPNPANQVINIAVRGYDEQKVIDVFDTNGQKVLTQKVSDNNSTLNISKLSKGVYFIRVSKKDGTFVSQKKFIKE
jgi:hypothetical protein